MASSSLPLTLPFPHRSRSNTKALTFRCSHFLLHSLPTSIVCLATQNPDREEARWLREEERWIREEQRWLREEQRWIREREKLLLEISDLQLRIQSLESHKGTDTTISNIAALLQVLKEKNRISESGSSSKPMVLENAKEEEEEVVAEQLENAKEEEEPEEEEEEEEKVKVSEAVKKKKKRVTLKVGSEGEEVQAMQEALLKLGFYSGEEDMEFSSFSSGTARAVKTWQASLGVREDGVMTEELLQMLVMDQIMDEEDVVKTDKVTMKQETKEGGNGAVKTQVSETQQGNRGNEVSQHRVFLLGENRWEDPSRLNKPIQSTVTTKTKCITCRGEGRLMCLECDGTGEPNIEPQFMEWVDDDTRCMYCEGLGYTVCDVCHGKTAAV